MAWQRVESDLDGKLLLRFDPYRLTVETVTRRYSPSTGRLRLVETVSLLSAMPPDLAGTLSAAIREYLTLAAQATAGTAVAGGPPPC